MNKLITKYVQVLNPKSKRYILIDKHEGKIVSQKKSSGVYKRPKAMVIEYGMSNNSVNNSFDSDIVKKEI